MNVLVINSGSSSLKFQVIDEAKRDVLLKGHVDGIGLDSCAFKFNGEVFDLSVKNHVEAIKLVLSKIDGFKIDVVGHRFVHGGTLYKESVIVSDKVLEDLEALASLAPLHNPHNLEGIRACMSVLDVPQVTVFDTSFHQTIPKYAATYALPKNLVEEHKIQKYGFHGTSHNYLMLEAKRLLGRGKVNLVTCHLGNGASVSCIKHSKCIDTSMGFSPLQGLVMGTRSGDVDPGLVLFLQEKLKMSSSDVCDLLNKKSGLLGLSNSSDMRDIYSKILDGDVDASLALDVFVYRLIHYIGAYFALMGEDVHAVVFSGGIGEGAFYLRKKVALMLKHLGVSIDFDKNMKNNGFITESSVISTSSSKVKLLVIPANEELLIALDCARLLKGLSKIDEL